MKENDDMHRSLFSDPLSRNSTKEMNEWTLKFREMNQEELFGEIRDFIEIEFDGKERLMSDAQMTEQQYATTIGNLVDTLKTVNSDINPDALAGTYTLLGDIRTCTCCGPMSQEEETLLTAKARKAEELLR